ncbi:hypothetical protein HOC90_04540 [Candidatus Falkowbacteria bacterium]|jgi:hypothetical protein|nr:hypothetical protein [Candidatus Falkowbacteria bacterium]
MEKSFEKINTGHKVEGEEEKESFGEEKSVESGSEELDEYREEGQNLIDSYKRLFVTFAKDVSLDFKLGNGFYIDLKNGEVNMDAKWFKDKEFNKDQILWATMHELSHFRDLADDPEQMMKNFDYIRERAKETGASIMEKWEEKFGATNPDFIDKLKKQMPTSKKDPSKTMNAVERSAYKIHHTFYNIFDDIYVNNLVSRIAPKYEEDREGGQEISRLYQKNLFAKSDYQTLPRHLQFIYKLIREEMVKDEDVAVTPEIQNIMEAKMDFMGKKYTPSEIVDNFVKPRKGRNTKPGQRYLALQRTLEPIFEELLQKDLDEWDPQMPPEKPEGEPQKGEGEAGDPNPFVDDYNEHEENNPDQISEEDMENWAKKQQDDKKAEEKEKASKEIEEGKSTEEKAQEAQDDMDKKWCEENNIDHNAFGRFKQVEASIEPYLDELSVLWEKIIYGSKRNIERGIEGHYKAGTELAIQKVIEEFPKIEKGKLEETRIYKKPVIKEALVQKPELIRIRLAGDMSGSMDRDKIRILQQCFVLILSSLQEFNTKLSFTRSKTKSKLEADTEAWIFGSEAQKIKNFRKDGGMDGERKEIIKIFEKLQNTIGSTSDDKPLKEISRSLSQKDKKEIAKEKIIEIVFEITDGGSDNPQTTRQVVDELIDSGVITRAFQIGKVDAGDKKKFQQVWNNGRKDNLGEVVGENIGNLIPAITKTLEQYMKNIRL